MLELVDGRAASKSLATIGTRHPERCKGFASWTAQKFEVRSGETLNVGLDGESMEMESPLNCSIRPQHFRVRLPGHAIGYSPAARR